MMVTYAGNPAFLAHLGSRWHILVRARVGWSRGTALGVWLSLGAGAWASLDVALVFVSCRAWWLWGSQQQCPFCKAKAS